MAAGTRDDRPKYPPPRHRSESHGLSDAEEAERVARAQAAGRATRSERRWAKPPAQQPRSKGPRDPKEFCAEVLDRLLGLERK